MIKSFYCYFFEAKQIVRAPVEAVFLALTATVRWVMLFGGGWVLNPTGYHAEALKENC